MTGVTLEKISDPDKYMFYEQGMGGGVIYFNKISISFIWTWIIYMDVLWDNICLSIILHGSKA